MAKFGRKLLQLCELLDYAGRPTFVSSESIAVGGNSHTLREAIDTIGVYGAYCLRDGFPGARLKPIVYVAEAGSEAHLQKIHLDVWTQGVVPFLLVLLDDRVHVLSAFAAPAALGDPFDLGDARKLPDKLKDFHASRIGSSIVWSDFDLNIGGGVDQSLIDGIEALHALAVSRYPALKRDPALVNATIGKLIYIYVLVDRGILTRAWLEGRGLAMDPSLANFLDSLFLEADPGTPARWTADVAFKVFDAVDEVLNGSVFVLDPRQREAIPDGLLHLFHEVVRLGTTFWDGDTQLSFFGVSFRILRTETISAMYERFVGMEDEKAKTQDGVFYTPPHLADHVLDRVDSVSAFSRDSVVLDVSAGSGIFLVGAFRRIMEQQTPPGGWTPGHIHDAAALLTDCIFGLEKHAGAVAVARFSLLLTLLDYVGRGNMEELVSAAGKVKFLPELGQNIRVANAFDKSLDLPKATHLIGNPPWSSATGQRDRTNRSVLEPVAPGSIASFMAELDAEKIGFSRQRLSDMFLWLAHRRFAADGGVIALILPTKSLVGRQSVRFASTVAERLSVRWVGNFSHLRRKLFIKAEAAACAVIAVNRHPDSRDRVAVYRPLLTSLPGGKKKEVWGLLALPTDIQFQRSMSLADGSNGWMAKIMLSDLDRRMHDALSEWSRSNRKTFGDFLGRSRLIISKGGSRKETGIFRGHDEDAPQFSIFPLTRRDLNKVTGDYRGYFAGNVILVPRSMQLANYYPDPVAYSSSYNAIIPERQYLAFKDDAATAGAIEPLPYAAREALLGYLNSQVLRYFASLFGATYLIDKTRLELNDLLALPCPFEDIGDPAFLTLKNRSADDTALLHAMNAGADFRNAFDEFARLRHGFANARVPGDILKPATGSERDRYFDRLVPELKAAIGADAQVKTYTDATSGLTRILVALEDEPDPLSDMDLAGRYLGSSLVTSGPGSRTAMIHKGAILNAWTLDQAVADAIAVGIAMRSH